MRSDGFKAGGKEKMDQNDFSEKFSKLYLTVHAMYKRPNDPEANEIVYELFYESVKNFGFDAVKKAFSIHIQNPDNGQWMPKPADIIRIISGTSKDNSQVAWANVKKSISVVGSYQTVVFDDPIIHRVIQDMGGWISLCYTYLDELPFKGNEFKTRYTAYKSSGETPDYPAKLYGLHESENSTKGLIEHITEPVFIGDHEKAKQVLKIGSNRPSLQISGIDNGLAKIELKVIK